VIRLKIGGKIKNIKLNSHIVSVITPIKPISYEDGIKRIDKILSKICKN
jgi:hypothetical protein